MVELIRLAAGKRRTLITQLAQTQAAATCLPQFSASVPLRLPEGPLTTNHSPAIWEIGRQSYTVTVFGLSRYSDTETLTYINLLLSSVDICECVEVHRYIFNACVTEWHVLAKGCARLVFGCKLEMGSVVEGGCSCHRRRQTVNERIMNSCVNKWKALSWAGFA